MLLLLPRLVVGTISFQFVWWWSNMARCFTSGISSSSSSIFQLEWNCTCNDRHFIAAPTAPTAKFADALVEKSDDQIVPLCLPILLFSFITILLVV